jgi:hypothetical protein
MQPLQHHVSVLTLTLALAATGCRSSAATRVVEVDPAQRAELLAAVSGLQGRWVMQTPDGPAYTEFALTSSGSAVRETMFPGTPHEMTNMYALDGNSLVLTHYCAGGNQPRMRAERLVDGRLEFLPDGVGDLKAPDELYMGAMTLVRIDADHIEERWVAYNQGEEDHSPVFTLERVK